MQAMLYVVAVVMGVLGYQRRLWWLPAGMACAFIAWQAFWYYTEPNWRREAGVAPPAYVLFPAAVVMNLVVFYVAYGLGRGLARWRKGRPPA